MAYSRSHVLLWSLLLCVFCSGSCTGLERARLSIQHASVDALEDIDQGDRNLETTRPSLTKSSAAASQVTQQHHPLTGMLWKRPTRPYRRNPSPGLSAAVGDSIVADGGFIGVLSRLPGYEWDNYGVIGSNTRNMIERSEDWAQPMYREILLMGNINDLSPRVTAQWTISNLRVAYRRARRTGARVVAVTSTPFAGHRGWTESEQADQDAVNAWIMSGADGLIDVAVDAYHPLESSAGSRRLDERFARSDGLHLNDAGQRRLGNIIIEQAYGAHGGSSPIASNVVAGPGPSIRTR